MIVLKDNSKTEIEIALKKLEDIKSNNNNSDDSKLDTEISERKEADNKLSTLIKVETSSRKEADNNLRSLIKVERAERIVAEEALDNSITKVESSLNNVVNLIPAQATTTNQLADKDFVNSSITSNTADFIGTFNSLEELKAYSGTVATNDYAFVVTKDESGNTIYNRYKYNGSWIFEYSLNNSSFTSEQWKAINSGITADIVALIKKFSFETVYPVGSIYTSTNATDPATLFGFGTWERIKDTFLLAAGDNFEAASTGGSSSITLKVNNLPKHVHNYTPSGTISNKFTGVNAQINVSGANHTHTAGSGHGSGFMVDTPHVEAHGAGYYGSFVKETAYSGVLTMSGNYTPQGNVSSTFTGTSLVTSQTGSGEAFENLPPYLAVYVWKRTA